MKSVQSLGALIRGFSCFKWRNYLQNVQLLCLLQADIMHLTIYYFINTTELFHLIGSYLLC